MGIRARRGTDETLFALIKAFHQDRIARISTNVHMSKTTERSSGNFQNPTITDAVIDSANASNEATLVTLCKEIRSILKLHAEDNVAHKVADTVFDDAVGTEPTDTASCITWLNTAKAAYGVHIGSTTYHYTADATNTIIAADATNEASAITLANELKTDLNAHMAAALGGYGVLVVPA